MTFPTQLKQSWKTFKENKKLVPIAVVIDALFFYFFAKLHFKIFMGITEHISTAMKIIQEKTNTLSPAELASFDKVLMQDTAFVAAYHTILKFILLFLLGSFGIWILFQGINWALANRFVKGKFNYIKYSVRFIGFTLFWFFCFLTSLILLVYFSDYSAFAPLPLISQKGVQYIYLFFFLIMAYFMLISYSILTEKNVFKNTFRLGITKVKRILPAFILVIIPLMIASLLVFLIFKLHYLASLFYILIVLFPLFTLARVYLITVVMKSFRKIKK